MSPAEAVTSASELNADLQEYCSFAADADLPTNSKPARPTSFEPLTNKRLWGLGLLPLVEGVELKSVIRAIEELKGMDRMRGVVMGTRGLGKGLDDPVRAGRRSRTAFQVRTS
jgi:aminocarboxymuconate-semialdehyde decarboxylase